ncbi:YbaK/EbsC family protein [Kineococcus sp. NUM-3379]
MDTPHRNVALVRDALAARGCSAEVRVLADAVRTAAEAAAALGVPAGAIANSLVFLLRTDDGEEALLVLTSGAHRVDVRALGAALGGTVSRADATRVREATGQPIGGVAPVGHPTALRTVVDEHLRSYPRVWAAAGHPHAVFPTSHDELLALTGGVSMRVAAPAEPTGPDGAAGRGQGVGPAGPPSPGPRAPAAG